MQGLSQQSITFLRELKYAKVKTQDFDKWNLQYAQLFSELYAITSITQHSLNDLPLGQWVISFDGEDEQMNLSFTFKLHLEKLSFFPQIKICIQPHDTSTIQVDQSNYIYKRSQTNLAMKRFFNSAAYKRYFKPYANESAGLMTVIPMKQITSRHFGEYLVHLIRMMQPYLLAISNSESQRQVAA